MLDKHLTVKTYGAADKDLLFFGITTALRFWTAGFSE